MKGFRPYEAESGGKRTDAEEKNVRSSSPSRSTTTTTTSGETFYTTADDDEPISPPPSPRTRRRMAKLASHSTSTSAFTPLPRSSSPSNSTSNSTSTSYHLPGSYPRSPTKKMMPSRQTLSVAANIPSSHLPTSLSPNPSRSRSPQKLSSSQQEEEEIEKQLITNAPSSSKKLRSVSPTNAQSHYPTLDIHLSATQQEEKEVAEDLQPTLPSTSHLPSATRQVNSPSKQGSESAAMSSLTTISSGKGKNKVEVKTEIASKEESSRTKQVTLSIIEELGGPQGTRESDILASLIFHFNPKEERQDELRYSCVFLAIVQKSPMS